MMGIKNNVEIVMPFLKEKKIPFLFLLVLITLSLVKDSLPIFLRIAFFENPNKNIEIPSLKGLITYRPQILKDKGYFRSGNINKKISKRKSR